MSEYQFKGTPGKWKVTKIGEANPMVNSCGFHELEPRMDIWFSNAHTVKSASEALANAHLIAAAPDLLEACVAALEVVDSREVYEKLQQAIHKALNL